MSNLRDILSKYEIKDLEPSEDRILWRYTDIPSLIEILTYEYLPLIRVSRLSDPSEGAVLKAAINKLPLKQLILGKILYLIYTKKLLLFHVGVKAKKNLHLCGKGLHYRYRYNRYYCSYTVRRFSVKVQFSNEGEKYEC